MVSTMLTLIFSFFLSMNANEGHARDQNGAVCQWSLLCVKHVSPGRLQSSPFLCRFFSFLSFFLLRISLYSWAFPSASCAVSLRDTMTTSAAALSGANRGQRSRQAPTLCFLSSWRRLSGRRVGPPLFPALPRSSSLFLPSLKDKRQLLPIGPSCSQCSPAQAHHDV